MDQHIKIYFRMGISINKYRVDYVFIRMKFIFEKNVKNKSREELVIFVMDYSKLNLTKLREQLQKRKIKGRSKLKTRDVIVTVLQYHDQNPADKEGMQQLILSILNSNNSMDTPSIVPNTSRIKPRIAFTFEEIASSQPSIPAPLPAPSIPAPLPLPLPAPSIPAPLPYLYLHPQSLHTKP
jgi:hypothetical protein